MYIWLQEQLPAWEEKENLLGSEDEKTHADARSTYLRRPRAPSLKTDSRPIEATESTVLEEELVVAGEPLDELEELDFSAVVGIKFLEGLLEFLLRKLLSQLLEELL